MIHCVHSYPDWTDRAEEWWKFCGVRFPRSWTKTSLWVKITAPKHEIMQGMSDWKTPQGELYFIKTAYSTMTPLAESLSQKDKDDAYKHLGQCIRTQQD